MLGLHLSIWVRMIGGAAAETFHILTEGGDILATESGDQIITE